MFLQSSKPPRGTFMVLSNSDAILSPQMALSFPLPGINVVRFCKHSLAVCVETPVQWSTRCKFHCYFSFHTSTPADVGKNMTLSAKNQWNLVKRAKGMSDWIKVNVPPKHGRFTLKCEIPYFYGSARESSYTILGQELPHRNSTELSHLYQLRWLESLPWDHPSPWLWRIQFSHGFLLLSRLSLCKNSPFGWLGHHWKPWCFSSTRWVFLRPLG